MEHRGQDGETYREHELNRDIETVVDVRQTIISESGAYRNITEYLADTRENFAAM